MDYRFTLIPGDGIGPEVTDAVVRVLRATGVSIDWEVMQAGAAAEEAPPLCQLEARAQLRGGRDALA